MDLHSNIPLSNYTTMRLGGLARFMKDVHTAEEVRDLCQYASANQLPLFVLGGGSNTIAHDELYDGIVMRNRIMGYEVVSDSPAETTIRVGAGENWDETVRRTVEANLTGIEALSGIPGTVGAAPVQNIGAYGQEVADSIVTIEAYDILADGLVTLTPEQCDFRYRHSMFRGDAAGRYVIVAVVFRLTKTAPQPPFYQALEQYFSAHEITLFTAATVRQAVLAIRTDKLPDPTERPNAGSFFKNAIIDEWQFNELRQQFPDMPGWPMPNKQYKIPTGWLIEQCGLKGQLLHGMRVHDKNALVLINESASSYADLAAARTEIHDAVRDKFQISIVQEPLELTLAR